jgi:hypothetical protein
VDKRKTIHDPQSTINDPLRPPESQPRNTGLPSGDQSEVEPPGPIPNPEVKRLSADGSGTTGPVRVGRRQVNARHLGNKVPGFFLYAYRGVLRIHDAQAREALG